MQNIDIVLLCCAAKQGQLPTSGCEPQVRLLLWQLLRPSVPRTCYMNSTTWRTNGKEVAVALQRHVLLHVPSAVRQRRVHIRLVALLQPLLDLQKECAM